MSLTSVSMASLSLQTARMQRPVRGQMKNRASSLVSSAPRWYLSACWNSEVLEAMPSGRPSHEF